MITCFTATDQLSFVVCPQEDMEQCPYDPGHRVPVRTLEKHKASCRLRKMGYSAEEQVGQTKTRQDNLEVQW